MKSTRLIMILLVIIGVSTTLFCQESPISKSLSIKVGNNDGLFKDTNFSPLNYKEDGIVFGVDYIQPTRLGHLFGLRLDFSSSTLHTKNIDHFTSTYYQGTIAIEYLKKYSKEDSSRNFYVGGEFKTNNQIVFFEGTESFTYLFNHSLGIKGRLDWQQRENLSFSAKLALPIVNYLVRPPHNGFNKTTEANEEAPLRLITEEGKVTSLNTFLELNAEFRTRYSFSDRFAVFFDASLLYQRHRDIHQFTRLNYQTSLGLTFTLGKIENN